MRDPALPAAAIFVKTPGHSPVKTRLAAHIGTSPAERLHLACARAVAAVLRQCASRITGYYAVAEPDAHARWPGLPVVAQCDGALGTRLAHVFATLQARHRRVLLLGADAPQLHAALLNLAMDWLDQDGPRIAVGPADDGGFWLFGANCPLPRGFWERIPYSHADTCARLLAAAEGVAAILQLPALRDLDTAADLAPLRTALAALPQALPEQRELALLLDRIALADFPRGHG